VSVFFSVALACLSISLSSPAPVRRKRVIWMAAVMLVLWITAFLLWYHDLSRREPVLSVSLAAVGTVGVTLWLIPGDGRIARQWLWVGTFLIAFLTLLSVTLVDWPVWPDAVPEALLQATRDDPGNIERFHCYDMGGFIDHEWLWRIDAGPEVLRAIVPKLGLTRVANAPPEFWRMLPYYWPPSLAPGAQLYSTPGFSRGSGCQYLVLVDVQRGLAVVWVKSLFG
jgi:hypothetical protein